MSSLAMRIVRSVKSFWIGSMISIQMTTSERRKGERSNYLEMTLDNTTPGSLKLDMTEYVKSMVEEFQLFKAVMQPWNENLFKSGKN